MRNKRILWLTQTALFIALLIVLQVVTKGFGQFVTGACVNLVLISAVLLTGLGAGATVALVSPVLAAAMGIAPALMQIVPCIMLGNLTLVVIIWIIMKNTGGVQKVLSWCCAVPVAAVCKALVLWLSIVKLILPMMSALPEKQVQVMSATFSWPQLVTALLGGLLAAIIVPLVQRARLKGKSI